VIAGLQSNNHFLLPAMAPIFYNIGQLFGVTILAPKTGFHLGAFTLPAFGMGERGMVYGVIMGAFLHLAIQIPGLVKFKFKWSPVINLKDPKVIQVLKVLGPRILTMFFIQMTYVFKDNMASRLTTGAISALTYGWMIMQVPETLVGTAIGTAMLPTLSESFAKEEGEKFKDTIHRAFRVLLGLTLPISVILSFGLGPLLAAVFKLDAQSHQLLLWVTQGYLIGLAGQCLLEVVNRSFYSQQDATMPLIGAVVNLAIFVSLGFLLMGPLGAGGISLADSTAFTIESLLLVTILNLRLIDPGKIIKSTWQRFIAVIKSSSMAISTILRAVLSMLAAFGIMQAVGKLLPSAMHPFLTGTVLLLAGTVAAIPCVWTEVRQFLHL